MPKCKTLTLSLIISAALPAYVQAEHSHNAVELDKVTVSGQEPEAIASHGMLSEQEIDAKQASTSDTTQLLLDIPGVTLYGAGGVSGLPVIHGLGDDRLRIKVDEMDLISACANHMNSPLSYINPTNVSTIDVFAGISPVSMGGDSIGGTVAVESKEPEFAKPGEVLTKGEIGGFYRSNNDARGGNVSATLATEHFNLNYNGSVAKANNYEAGDAFKAADLAAAGRGWLDGDEVGSTSYETRNHQLGMAIHQDNHLLELDLALQDIPYQGFPNQRMDMTENKSERVNLRYTGSYDWGQLKANAYNEHTRHKMQFGDDKLFWYGAPEGEPGPIGMSKAAGMPMDTEGDNKGLKLMADVSLSQRDLLRIGTEVQQYDLDDWWDASGGMMWPNTFWNINHGERDRYAAFAEWEAAWNTEWLTQLGLRHETVKMDTGNVQSYSNTGMMPYSGNDDETFNSADRSKTDNNLDITAVARFTPSTTQTYEFGYASKTRSPNLYERYAWSTHPMSMEMVNFAGDGNGYVGNLELEPETAHTLSAKLDWHDAEQTRWGVEFSPYFTYVDDYIDAERCTDGIACTAANLTSTDGFVYLQFVNQSARLYGADLSGHLQLAQTASMGTFTSRGSVSYVRGKNRDTGDNLYNIMPLNAKLALDHEFGRWNSSVELELVTSKHNVSAERNEVETDGYGLLHLRTSYEWKQARFDLGIENVFDKFYNHPLGGAYLGQGKTMANTMMGGPEWGLPVPGMGRSLYTGVTYKF